MYLFINHALFISSNVSSHSKNQVLITWKLLVTTKLFCNTKSVTHRLCSGPLCAELDDFPWKLCTNIDRSKAIRGGNTSVFRSTKDATYNEEDQTVRMFLRGRPIHLQAPSDLADGYDLTKVETAPSQRLKLDWVYGYRGRDCRSNLYFLPTGEMVYFVAATVVLYNVEEQAQRHYLGHTDDVKW